MSYKRVKYSPWENIKATMKEIVAKHAKYDRSPFTFFEGTSNIVIFNFLPMLQELREEIKNDKYHKYFGKITLDRLDDVLNLYRCFEKMGTWDDKLKIMDTMINNKKVSVYLGGILADITPEIVDLFVNYLDEVESIAFQSYEVRSLFDKLTSLPPANLEIVYGAYIDSKETDYELPEEWIEAMVENKFKEFSVAAMKAAMPKINQIADEYYKEKSHMDDDSPIRNLRKVIDIMADRGFPIGYFMMEESFSKIYNIKDDDLKCNPYGLLKAYNVNMQCVYDIIENINDTIMCINENKTACGSFTLDERIRMLNYYGIRFKATDDSIEIDRGNMVSQKLDWGGNSISDYKWIVSNSFQLLLDIQSIQGLLFIALETNSEGKCALTELSQSAFLFLMKIYVKYSLYALEPHFMSALEPYPFDENSIALIPLLFECFRKYYRLSNPFRNLSYVIHPVDLVHQFIKRYNRSKDYDMETSLKKISNTFSIKKSPIKLKESSVVKDNLTAIANYKLISSFLFFGCCEHKGSKLIDGVMFSNNFCYKTILKLHPDDSELNNTRIDLSVDIEANACNVIMDTLSDITKSNIEFKNALFTMSSYISSYTLKTEGGRAYPVPEPAVIAFLAYITGIQNFTPKKEYDHPVLIRESELIDDEEEE